MAGRTIIYAIALTLSFAGKPALAEHRAAGLNGFDGGSVLSGGRGAAQVQGGQTATAGGGGMGGGGQGATYKQSTLAREGIAKLSESSIKNITEAGKSTSDGIQKQTANFLGGLDKLEVKAPDSKVQDGLAEQVASINKESRDAGDLAAPIVQGLEKSNATQIENLKAIAERLKPPATPPSVAVAAAAPKVSDRVKTLGPASRQVAGLDNFVGSTNGLAGPSPGNGIPGVANGPNALKHNGTTGLGFRASIDTSGTYNPPSLGHH